MIFVRFASGREVSFPTKGNPRLESAAEEDVGLIEISPFGLHWVSEEGDADPMQSLLRIKPQDAARWWR